MIRRVLQVAAGVALSCAPIETRSAVCRQIYSDSEQVNYSDYSFNPDMVTGEGVIVDTSGFVVDPDEIDLAFAEVEACSGQAIERCGIGVKIADDWRETDGGEQIFPCPSASPTGWCYGILQEPSIAVVTPDLVALPHELIHARFHAHHGDQTFLRCGR